MKAEGNSKIGILGCHDTERPCRLDLFRQPDASRRRIAS
jgi:hypothetical protein